MDYTNFLTYPLEILGIDETYNDYLNEIKAFVLSEIGYTGVVEDLTSVLPYFVFYYFCEDKSSEVFATVGETAKVKEFTTQNIYKKLNAWNFGVDKLKKICSEKGTKASDNYTSNRSFL